MTPRFTSRRPQPDRGKGSRNFRANTARPWQKWSACNWRSHRARNQTSREDSVSDHIDGLMQQQAVKIINIEKVLLGNRSVKRWSALAKMRHDPHKRSPEFHFFGREFRDLLASRQQRCFRSHLAKPSRQSLPPSRRDPPRPGSSRSVGGPLESKLAAKLHTSLGSSKSGSVGITAPLGTHAFLRGSFWSPR
jgi:hypothetical protein